MKVGAPIRRILTFLAVFTMIVFALVVVRETAGVVALAHTFHPVAGQIALWTLVLVYGICLGVPLILFVRLPKPLVPPASDTDPAFPEHLSNLRSRLVKNTHLRNVTITPDRASIQAALDLLEIRANEEIREVAKLVFLSTAISQSGRLDGLFVLVAQTRLVWKVAHIYQQRASARELLHLYANVAATVFAAESLEDLDLAEVAEPLVAPLLEAAGVGVTVVLAPVATVLADSLLQGTVNGLLTFRVGCITKRYSAQSQARTEGGLARGGRDARRRPHGPHEDGHEDRVGYGAPYHDGQGEGGGGTRRRVPPWRHGRLRGLRGGTQDGVVAND